MNYWYIIEDKHTNKKQCVIFRCKHKLYMEYFAAELLFCLLLLNTKLLRPQLTKGTSKMAKLLKRLGTWAIACTLQR